LNTTFTQPIPKFIDNNFIIHHVFSQKSIGDVFFKWERLFVFITMIFSLFIIIKPFKRYYKRSILLFSLVLFFVVIAESYLYFPKIRSDKFDPAQKFPYVDFIKKDNDLFRIYGTEQTTMPQENLFFRVSDIRIVSPLLYNRYASFFRELLINQHQEDYNPTLTSKEITMDNIPNNLISLLNVKYILSNNYFPTKSIYKLVYDNELKIYLNKNFLPRAFLINHVVPGLNQKQIFSYLKSDSFNPNKEAVVEGITNTTISKLNNVHKHGTSIATIRQYQSDKVIIDTKTDSPKLLVLIDLYYPGWKAYVDGKETHIYPTNYIMRGIFIPKGYHKVEFIYRPKSFLIGAIISLFTACFTVFIIKFKYIKFAHD